MSDKDDDVLAATDDPDTIVDSNGRATTPLHEAVSAAVEADAATNKPQSADTSGGTAAAGSDDGEDDNMGGDDVDESSARDDKTKAQQPANIFARYASGSPEEVAARFTPKTFVSNGSSEPDNIAPLGGDRLSTLAPLHNATTDQADNAVRIVGGDSQVLDGNALRAVEAAISEATRANFDTSALQQQAAAIRSNVLNVRAAAPVMVPLMPLAKTPTPVE